MRERERRSTVPLPAGQDDADYGAVFHDLFLPVGRAFAPELIIVSAGFDAHARDPLAEMNVTERGFAAMTSALGRAGRGDLRRQAGALARGGCSTWPRLASSVRASLEVLTAGARTSPRRWDRPALAVAAARDALRAGGRVVPKT